MATQSRPSKDVMATTQDDSCGAEVTEQVVSQEDPHSGQKYRSSAKGEL